MVGGGHVVVEVEEEEDMLVVLVEEEDGDWDKCNSYGQDKGGEVVRYLEGSPEI